ncbi:MAG: hypothetical protein B6242_13550 [Anaerolineaceae bacterium 4572_78]|nr:MAG: hypothetical protein B6242_13550 [Anaerolineaceae bacterium 4572_78]
MARKPYAPVASYEKLKSVEQKIEQAQSVEELRKIVVQDGPKVGYKAFCYILSRKMTPESMKADEACVAAFSFEKAGKLDEALDVYQKITAVHKEHPIASAKLEELSE